MSGQKHQPCHRPR